MALKERIMPALTLFFLAPAIGELLSGSSPPLEFFNPFSLFLLCLLYGGGALLVREAVFRWKGGWLSMLLLGAAYGIAEEGLACKSFFDPSWMDIGVLGSYGRWAGINWIWALELTAFHAVFSISSSIILVTVMFPGKKDDPWLSRRGLCLAGAGFLFIIAFCYFFLTPYRPPMPQYIAAAMVAAGLVVLAWKLPHPFPWEKIAGTAGGAKLVSVRWFFLFGLAWTSMLFFCSWVLVSLSPWAPLTGLLMVSFFLITGMVLARKSGHGRNWNQRHQLGLVAGALGFFIFLGFLLEAGGVLGMSIVAIGFAIFLWWLMRRLTLAEKEISTGGEGGCPA